MPEIIPLGWFHTIMGIIALVSGAYTLFKFKEITHHTRSGQIYLVTTLITAGTALAIYQHGFFGPAHGLAVMTREQASDQMADRMVPKVRRHVADPQWPIGIARPLGR